MIGRVAGTISGWGREGGYFASAEDADAFEAELTSILLNQKAAFNSPVWFNVGFEEKPQCSACQPYHALVSTPEGMVPIGELVEGEQIGREVYDASGVDASRRRQDQRPQARDASEAAQRAASSKPRRTMSSRPSQSDAPSLSGFVSISSSRGCASTFTPTAPRSPTEPLSQRADPPRRSLTALTIWRPLDETTRVDRAEAALAGWLQADGFVGQYQGGTNRSLTIEFQVANDDEYAWVMENLDVALPDVHRKVRTADTQEVRGAEDPPLRRGAPGLRGTLGAHSREARRCACPSHLWTATHEEICAYLRSVFQADGYMTVRREHGYENARIGFAVIGEKWTEDLQILLNSIGIYSRRTHKREKRDDRHDLHELSIGIGSERVRFAELIGFVGKEKQRRLLAVAGACATRRSAPICAKKRSSRSRIAASRTSTTSRPSRAST